MTNISGMDFNNTPFSIPGKMVSGVDTPGQIARPYTSVNRRNIDAVVRQIESNSKAARKAIEDVRKELELFVVDESSETVTLHTDGIKRILTLIAQLNVSFENLLSATE